jgi:HSP20 family molecular chaperone IbpA
MRDYQLSTVSDIFRMFDDFMTLAEPVTLPTALIRGTFPPTDLIRDGAGNLCYRFAVAGYKESEISLEFKDESLVLELKPEEKKQDDNVRYIQRGIKSGKTCLSALVPATKYDVSKSTASLEDGILTVDIPLREDSKPMSVPITKIGK